MWRSLNVSPYTIHTSDNTNIQSIKIAHLEPSTKYWFNYLTLFRHVIGLAFPCDFFFKVQNIYLGIDAGLLRVTDEGSLPEIAQYGPFYLPLNVFTASRGSNSYYILFILSSQQTHCINLKKKKTFFHMY